MTTLDLQVSAATDDAHEADDNTLFNSGAVVVKAESDPSGGSRYNGGARFTGVTVPNGATIDVAYIAVHAPATNRDDPNVDIHCEDVDDADDFGATADVTGRTRTTNFTTWTATGIGTGEVNSPGIESVVQEVVNRAGWNGGNDMVVLVDGRSDSPQDFRMVSYESDTSKAVKLHIEYSTGKTRPVKPITGHVPVHQLQL